MAKLDNTIPMAEMRASIEPFIHRRIVVLPEDATAMQAARAMAENRIGCIVVGDHEGHISGLITDRDLACGLSAYLGDMNVPISELMTEKPLVVDEHATIHDVVALMVENGIRRVPVVQRTRGDREKCIGMITVDDLVIARAIGFDDLVKIVRSQVYRRGGVAFRQLGEEEEGSDRSQAHTEQTFNRFFRAVAEKTGLPGEQAIELGKTVLSAFVERLHATAAAHLVAQLPRKLQDELLDLPAGPNRNISARSIVEGISVRCNISYESALRALPRFCLALKELLAGHEFDHLRMQLPKDICRLFDEPAARRGKMAA